LDRDKFSSGVTAVTALANLSSTGPANTNMNVVHTIEDLNSAACSNHRCALHIAAGQFAANSWLDICPNFNPAPVPPDKTPPPELTATQCTSLGPWTNIWNIVSKIPTGSNRPVAIYFIDEPSIRRALQDASKHYVKWQYAAYVCTLRQALSAYQLSSIKIFTILNFSALGPDNTQNNITNEIRHQMPSAGCPAQVNSRPDWIGIDNYDWKVTGGATDTSAIYAAYSTYFPPPPPNVTPTYPLWVLVPPAAFDAAVTETNSTTFNDTELHDRIQAYWDFLWTYPGTPVVAIMTFRFDPKVMTVPVGVNPLDHNNPNNPYWRSRDLLKFMGNTITP
jgi:hypothetical protein